MEEDTKIEEIEEQIISLQKLKHEFNKIIEKPIEPGIICGCIEQYYLPLV